MLTNPFFVDDTSLRAGTENVQRDRFQNPRFYSGSHDRHHVAMFTFLLGFM